MSYFVVGIAIAVLLALKCLLVKRTMNQNSQRFMNPKSFADEILESQCKKSGIDKIKQELEPESMMGIIRNNVAFLKSANPSTNQKINLQKLRNICLCIQLLQNPQIIQNNPYKDEIRSLNCSLLESWKGWLGKTRASSGLVGETAKYFQYLSKHFA